MGITTLKCSFVVSKQVSNDVSFSPRVSPLTLSFGEVKENQKES